LHNQITPPIFAAVVCLGTHKSIPLKVLVYKEVARDWLSDPLATICNGGKGANSCPNQCRLGAYKL